MNSLRFPVFLFCLLAMELMVAGETPRYVAPILQNERLISVIPRPDGGFVVASERWENIELAPNYRERRGTHAIVRIVGTDGGIRSSIEIGGTNLENVAGAALQKSGNIVLAGSTNSADFPRVEALFPGVYQDTSGSIHAPLTGFVVVLAPDLSTIVRSTLLGGISQNYSGTQILKLALDGKDNIYLSGKTGSADFPTAVSGKAIVSSPTLDAADGKVREGFVAKFDADLSNYLFSTFLGGTRPYCEGVSSCSGLMYESVPIDFSVEADGGIAVLSVNSNLPATPGSIDLRSVYPPPAASDSRGVTVAMLDSDAAEVTWSGTLGFWPAAPQRSGEPIPARLAIGDAGRVYIAVTVNNGEIAGARAPALDLLEVSANGQFLLNRTILGEGSVGALDALQLDNEGRIWVSGDGGFPIWEPILPESRSGSQFLARLNIANKTVDRYLLLPNGNADAGITTNENGDVVVWGHGGAVQTLAANEGVSKAILGAANSAAISTSGLVSPGEMISLYGVGFGPQDGEDAKFDASGKLPSMLNGVEVLLNGVPSPLLYASGEQVNLIATFDEASLAKNEGKVRLEIRYQGEPLTEAVLQIAQAQPYVFGMVRRWTDGNLQNRVENFAIALNQDGTLNDAGHPSRRGEAFVIWMNGTGAWRDAVQDGQQTLPPYNRPKLKLRAMLTLHPNGANAIEVPVEYFGAAPFFAAGLIQTNVRIPESFPVSTGREVQLLLSLFEETDGGPVKVADASPVYLSIDK